jgi:threonine/homoserine/homoserine lactone efflux protein
VGQAIGQSLPIAVGIALSPLPIVAVVLMLVTDRGRVNGPAFILGWWIGLAVVGAIVLIIGAGAGASSVNGPATWASLVKLILGVLLLIVAARQWQGRPHEGAEPVTPKWMGGLEAFTPAKAVGAGAVLSGLNPKNLLLAASGAATIATTGLSAGQTVLAYVVFVIIASVGVAAPVVLSFGLGDRAGPLLERLKGWMTANNAVIMAVLLLVIGAKLIGDALGELTR